MTLVITYLFLSLTCLVILWSIYVHLSAHAMDPQHERNADVDWDSAYHDLRRAPAMRLQLHGVRVDTHTGDHTVVVANVWHGHVLDQDANTTGRWYSMTPTRFRIPIYIPLGEQLTLVDVLLIGGVADSVAVYYQDGARTAHDLLSLGA